jgi:prephenate dehydrogenase
LITDVGSTKQNIVAAAEKLGLAPRFVGSHPFAGDHRSGWSASRKEMFKNQIVYLCPNAKTDTSTIGLAESFWTLLGATTVHMDAAAHDELLAWTSHLPHIVSTALAMTLAHKDIWRDQLGSGGRDVTRLAGGSVEMWTAILLENASAIDEALAGVERELAQFRQALRTGEPQRLSDLFDQARNWSNKR